MKAMRNFGLESAFLVLLTYVLTLFLIPLTFYTIKSKNRFTLRSVFNKLSNTIFSLQIKLIERQNKVLIVFGLILVVCIAGIFGINTNSRHYSIPKNTDLFKSFKFFEQNFGGSRTFELILESNNEEALNTPKNLETVFKIHDYLSEHPKLDFIKSPVSYYKTIHKAYYPSTYTTKPFTFNDKRIKTYNKEILKTLKTDYLSNRERTIFKFNGQMQDYGKKEIKELQYEILKKVKTLIGEKPINVQLSGIDVLIDISQQKSIRNTFYGLLIAILVVSLTLGFVFKNPTLALVAVILNLIPLVMTAGIMGYFNLVLRAETALIFTVGFVIAVDDTIHLLSKLQWERKKGASLHEATITAIKECGKAIIATSIILVGGFFILTLSNQNEISTLGFLIGIIVVVTLFVDLVIAPIIILKWFKRYL